ncbi:MAG: response regulator [Bacteroidales bacterium]|nr:response regulator [Bacteroidales bacterium]
MKKILAIDDQRDNLVSFQAIVKSYMPGCTIITSQSGKEGIKIAQNEQPDVILLDIIMPEMNGYETCSRLKADPSTRRIPVIMITAIKTDTESKVKALESGADAFLTKPVDPTELSAQISVMLRIKHAEDQLEKDKQNLEQLVEKRSTELFHSELRYRTLTSLAPVGVYQTDKEGKCIYVNQLWQEMAGLTPNEAEGEGWIKGIHPQDRNLVFQSWNRMVEEFGKWGVEYRFQNKEGKTTWVYGTANKTVDNQGEVTGYIGVNTDITELKQEHQALIESENKLHTLFHAMTDVVFEMDYEGTYLFIAPTSPELLYMVEKDIIGKRLHDIFPKPEADIFLSFIRECIDEKSTKTIEYPLIINNNTIWFEGKATPISQKSILYIARDVTPWRKAQIALKDSEEKYKSLFEKSEDAVLIISDERFVDCNQATVKMLRYEAKQDLLNTHPSELSPEKQSDGRSSFEKADEMMSIALKRGSHRFEWDHKKADGEVFPVEVLLTPIPNIDGKTIIHTVWRDISERKKAEKTQRILYNISNATNTSENLDELFQFIKDELHQIIDTTNFFIGLWDGESDTVSIPYIVDKADHFTSLPMKGSLTGYVIKKQQSLLATKEIFEKLEQQGEAEIIGTDSKIWLGVPMKSKGVVTGVIVLQSYDDEKAFTQADVEVLEFVSQQISLSIERKKREEELKEALKKATESDRLKSSFLATMSHELRTPLNAVIGFSDIIDKTFSLDEIIKMNQRINVSGKHLLTIIEDIFDISLIETGEIKIDNEKFDLVPFMLGIHTFVLAEQDALKKQHLEVTYQPPQNLNDVFLFSDQGKIKQILLNLLKNALKYTHDGSVKYGFMTEIQEEKSWLKFYVKDTGIGISQDLQHMIFEPFRQADESHTRVYGGAGLGLSISKKLTNLLGGELWVESTAGKGSTFFFTVPHEQPEVINPAKEFKGTGGIHSYPGKTVLIVEDEDSNYEYLNIILHMVGITTLFAQNGQGAIDLCKTNPAIDLVLMDVKMPMMSGYEATAVIKKYRPDLPVIAQTAHAIIGDKAKALEAGCDEYISKPINKEDLYKLIGKYFN